VSSLAERFAAYLGHCWPEGGEIRIDAFERIYGGASRETYRVRVSVREGAGTVEHRLILRRDPASSLIETDRSTEYRAYAAFHGSAVPVPRPLFLETDPHWLDRPFFVMEEVTGAVSSARLLGEPPYAAYLEKIGERKWRILGEIARADPERLGLTTAFAAPPLEGC